MEEYPSNDSFTIPRMAIKQSALIEIIRAESPGSIFARPKNHIRDKLIYREPYRLIPINNYQEGDFAIAPIEERIFGRCLILNKFSDKKIAKVFFIDDAVTAYVNDECICKMEESQRHFPWQVMHLTLGRVRTLHPHGWSQAQCEQFQQILNWFDYFEISASEFDMNTSANRPSILVKLYTVPIKKLATKKREEQMICVEELMAALIDDIIIGVFSKNLENPRIENLDVNNNKIGEQLIIDEFRERIPDDWQHEKGKKRQKSRHYYGPSDSDEEDEEVSSNSEWSLDHATHVPRHSAQTIKKFLNKAGELIGFIDNATIISPDEMFLRMINWKKEDDERIDEWLLDDTEELYGYSQELEMFYRDIKNQKPFEYEELAKMLDEGEVFAICHFKTNQNGEWHRVEVQGLQSDLGVVRFVDFGGTMNVKIRNLHRIHFIHCRRLPFCCPIRIRNIFELKNHFFDDDSAPVEEENNSMMMTMMMTMKRQWSADLRDQWIQIVPNDRPIQIAPNFDFDEKGVLQCDEIMIFQENSGIVEQFLKKNERRIQKLK